MTTYYRTDEAVKLLSENNTVTIKTADFESVSNALKSEHPNLKTFVTINGDKTTIEKR